MAECADYSLKIHISCRFLFLSAWGEMLLSWALVRPTRWQEEWVVLYGTYSHTVITFPAIKHTYKYTHTHTQMSPHIVRHKILQTPWKLQWHRGIVGSLALGPFWLFVFLTCLSKRRRQREWERGRERERATLSNWNLCLAFAFASLFTYFRSLPVYLLQYHS